MSLKLKILLILFYLGTISHAQKNEIKIDSIISNFIAKENIENYFFYKNYCVGCFRIAAQEDSTACITKGTYYQAYLFWKNNNKTKVKKFDNCGNFNTVKLKNNKIYNFYFRNFEKLKKRMFYLIKLKKIVL